MVVKREERLDRRVREAAWEHKPSVGQPRVDELMEWT